MVIDYAPIRILLLRWAHSKIEPQPFIQMMWSSWGGEYASTIFILNWWKPINDPHLSRHVLYDQYVFLLGQEFGPWAVPCPTPHGLCLGTAQDGLANGPPTIIFFLVIQNINLKIQTLDSKYFYALFFLIFDLTFIS